MPSRTLGPRTIAVLLSILVGLSHMSPGMAVAAPVQSVLSTLEDKDKKQDANAKDPGTDQDSELLDSPRATVKTFIKGMLRTPIARQQVNSTLNFSSGTTSTSVKSQVAKRLMQVMDFLQVNQDILPLLPTKTDPDTTTWQLFPLTIHDNQPGIRLKDLEGKEAVNRYAQLLEECAPDAEIMLVQTATNRWKFSSDTLSLANLDDLSTALVKVSQKTGYKIVDQSIAGRIRQMLPDYLRGEILLLAYWQWAGLAALLLLGLILDVVLRLLLRAFLKVINHQLKVQMPLQRTRKTIRGLGLVGTGILWIWVLPSLDLPLLVFNILNPAAHVFLVLAIIVAAFRLTDTVADIVGEKAKGTDNKLDDILVPLVSKTLKILIIILAIMNLAEFLSFQIGPLIAAVGLGSIGFAFAAQNTIENFFGSMTVILDRPFQVGDWVVVDGVEGTVEQVGMRSTRVRTFYNSLVTLPNSILTKQKVDNYGMRKYRRWNTKIGITYDTSPAEVDAFAEGIREIVRQHPYTRKDYYQVWLNEFGASALEILVYVFWEAPDWQTELRERHRLMTEIMRLAEAMGIEFAFPTQTVYLHRGASREGRLKTDVDRNILEREMMKIGRETVRQITKGASWKEQPPDPYHFRSAEETEELDSVGHEESIRKEASMDKESEQERQRAEEQRQRQIENHPAIGGEAIDTSEGLPPESDLGIEDQKDQRTQGDGGE